MPESAGFVTVRLADGGTWTRLDRLTDGRVMCCLRFAYVTRDRLSVDEEGDLPDVCQDCRAVELAEMARRGSSGSRSGPFSSGGGIVSQL